MHMENLSTHNVELKNSEFNYQNCWNYENKKKKLFFKEFDDVKQINTRTIKVMLLNVCTLQYFTVHITRPLAWDARRRLLFSTRMLYAALVAAHHHHQQRRNRNPHEIGQSQTVCRRPLRHWRRSQWIKILDFLRFRAANAAAFAKATLIPIRGSQRCLFDFCEGHERTSFSW